jgi:hypothetical protein
MTRLEAADDADEEYDLLQDELYEDPDPNLYGLDLGIAAAVIGLSAAKCVPASSCNAGTFGGSHHELYPLVAFYARKETVVHLLSCAEEAEIGLEGTDYGAIVAYADGVPAMRRFAASLIRSSSLFNSIEFSKPRTRKKAVGASPQAKLFD